MQHKCYHENNIFISEICSLKWRVKNNNKNSIDIETASCSAFWLILLYSDCLQGESNFLSAMRLVTQPCACAYVALFAHWMAYNHYAITHNHYAIAHAYNAANTHAEGSDQARWSQKLSLLVKTIRLTADILNIEQLSKLKIVAVFAGT